MAEQPQQQQKVRIAFPPHLQGGVYSNNLVVSHTREEFILDFMVVGPGAGAVTARVIISPGHMKRVAATVKEQLKKYEDKFGEIKSAEEPKVKLGFQP